MFRTKLTAVSIVSLWLSCVNVQAQQQPVYVAASKFEVVRFTPNSFVTSGPSRRSGDPPSSVADGFIRTIPVSPGASKPPSYRPFRSGGVGFTVSTFGAGVEFATPLSRHFDLRSGISVLAFAYPFSIDGVGYNARLDFISTTSTLDWYPRHGSFHISPGILYSRSSMNAIASVGPGESFELGDQAFLNSVNEPLSGTATLAFPRRFAPMVMAGFGNVIPRSKHRFSFPFEAGTAYTGAPVVKVNLSGTACTGGGCVNFANNSDAQASLRQEISRLNEDLKRFSIFPIISAGFAYHF